MIFRTVKHLMILCLIFVIICFLFYCGLLSGCKPPRLSFVDDPGRLAKYSSREMVNGREYYVINNYFCPAYYNYEDWGIVVLTVADVADEMEFRPYGIAGTNSRSQSIDLLIGGKNIACQYEKNFVTVCYNDESGNCYRTRLEMNDPRVACLFYNSDNKNRTELVDLWHQLNKEKEKHTVIFEVQKDKKDQ